MSSDNRGAVSAPSLFKSVVRTSAVYSLPFIMQRLVGIFMMPITTRFLTTSDYGIVDLIDQALTVITLLLGIRFSSALGFFYFQSDSPDHRRVAASTTVIGAAIIGIAAAAICWPFCPLLSQLIFKTPSIAPFFHIALLTWPVGFSMEALLSLIRVENRAGMFTLTAIVRLTLSVSSIVLFVAVLKMHVAGMLYAGLVAGSLAEVFLLTDALRRMRPAFEWRLFVQVVKYAMPLGVGGIAVFVINFGDRFLLPHYRPLSELGIYVVAYKIGMIISFFYGSFDGYWSAQVFDIMRRDDADRVFARMFTYVILGLSTVGLGLVICARPALTIMAAADFRAAAPLVPIVVLAYYIRSIGDFLRTLFLVSARTGYDAITNWIGSIVCIASYFLLIPRYGTFGAAWATVLAFLIITVISAIWTFRVRPYQIEAGRLAKIATALIPALLLWWMFPSSQLPMQIAIAAAALSLYVAALWILRFVTPGELHHGKEALQSALARFYPKSLDRPA